MVSQSPYLFTRTFEKDGYRDQVLVGLQLPSGEKMLKVGDVFADGSKVRDAYSGVETMVKDGEVRIDSDFDMVLLELL